MLIKKLQWVAAGVSLLALPVMLPSNARGVDTAPVLSECQNLSGAERVKCVTARARACSRSRPSGRTPPFCDQPGAAPPGITISPAVPADIPGGADQASLADAANFAWQEFIALNWPALTGTRDTPDESQLFGDPAFAGPLVWHTYRHKVEIYPGQGTPPGFDASKSDFGYSTVPPQYIYNAEALGQGASGSGEIPACSGQEPVETPSFINLDEASQIGLASMFAGQAPPYLATNQDPQLIRFLAKANQTHFVYVVNPDALVPSGEPLYIGTGVLPSQSSSSDQSSTDCTGVATTTFCTATINFKGFVEGGGTVTTLEEPFISFPAGTIHVKSAWRELTAGEEASGRFYTTTVRYYEETDAAGAEQDRCYREAVWGLLALHIEQKTPTAPSFIFATFEQADNLQTEDGTPVEDENGQPIAFPAATTTPGLEYQDGDPPTLNIVGTDYCESPEDRLFYVEASDFSGLPSGGAICQNARTHPIPQVIINANQEAHAAITAYASDNGIQNSVWSYYKLINVQYKPFDKSQIVPGTTSDLNESTFFTNNEVVETDYTLANFSGRISNEGPATDLPANFAAFNPDRTTFQNVLVFDENNKLSETYNMGGCMGCHGNAQLVGTDFSFILSGGRVPVPETPDVDPPGTTNAQPTVLP
ncbi:MAG: hypothetical protein L0K86_00025 [Actinomycetia bacterium]|nr:hypothetical protein [Actinomycetes bacterium]